MLRHIHRRRFGLLFLQGFFAGQLKTIIGRENIFDPGDGAANAAFCALIVVGDGFHRDVFTVVFEGDEKFVADGEAGRFAVRFVEFVVGGLQNIEHLEEYGFGGSDSAFEFFVGQSQFFSNRLMVSSLTGTITTI